MDNALQLMRSLTEAAPDQKTPEGDRRPQKPVKVLIVDHSHESLRELQLVLEPLSAEIVSARSGREALKLLLQDDFAAVLLDARMPDMDGFELAELIRQGSGSAATPILFMSESAEQEMLERAYGLGAVDYLQKPIIPFILRAKVSGFIDLARQAEQLRRQSEEIQALNTTLEQRGEEQMRLHTRVLESMTEGVSVSDEAGVIVYANAAEERIFGYGPAELVGQHVTVQNAYAPEENKRIVGEVMAELQSNGFWHGEWHNKRKDGTAFFTHARITAVELAGRKYWVCVQEDITARKRAEEAQRQSEAEFRQVADSMPQLVWVTRPDGYHEWYNRRWYEYTGTTPTEAAGEGWNNFFHPDDQEQAWAKWRHSLATGEEYEIEYRCRRHDGVYQWFLGRALPIRDESGAIVRWFGTCTDIDEQKQAAAHLHQQWHTFDTALSHSPDFTYIFDLEGRFTYANRALLNLWQKTFEEARGQNFFELDYPPELAEQLHKQIQQVITTKAPVRDQTPYSGPTGETRHYEYIFVPVFAEDGKVEAVAGSTRDVTERQQIEKALAEGEEKLQQIFQQAPVAILVLRGPDFIVELANPTYAALLEGRELIGRRFADVVPELGQHVWDAFKGVLATGEPFLATEWHIPYDYDRDGILEDHWFNVAYNPLRELDGSVGGILAVLTDVTVHVLARQEVERVNRELEEFAYVASHDLQEPLRMVNVYTQLLVREFCSHDLKSQKYAAFIREGVTRMETLIRDLLTYSRSVQRDELPVGKADLSVALAEAMSVLKNRIDENAAIITADPLPVLRGDTAQLAHVFQNLLSNAIKYRKKDVPPQIHISSELLGDHCVVCIHDNGIGFEQKYAQRIFGLFKRLHKEEYPGTGLGLAICQRVVERYGGRMWAEGRPRQGATFYFSLPRSEGE
jgi:PAS domain S-box-containing protein